MTGWRGPVLGVTMAVMEMSADDRMYDLLVRVVRGQRRRRDLGFEEPSGLPRETPDGEPQAVE